MVDELSLRASRRTSPRRSFDAGVSALPVNAKPDVALCKGRTPLTCAALFGSVDKPNCPGTHIEHHARTPAPGWLVSRRQEETGEDYGSSYSRSGWGFFVRHCLRAVAVSPRKKTTHPKTQRSSQCNPLHPGSKMQRRNGE